MPKQSLLDEISRMGNNAGNYRPHKMLILLAVIDLFEKNIISSKQIYYNNALKQSFSVRFNEFASSSDRNRPFAPFFHLRTQSFWKLIPNPGMEEILINTTTVGGPSQLEEIVNHAELSDDLLQILQNENRIKVLKLYIIDQLINHRNSPAQLTLPIDSIITRGFNNSFVDYINSLHCLSGDSDGALAESQAREKFFCQIQIEHEFVQNIFDRLTNHGKCRHVVLTGHAGDGKSTIALELLKRLKNIPANEPLSDGLQRREEFCFAGISIVIIKDLSEWSIAKQDEIFQEMYRGQCRYLLISNTGTLLSLFKRHHEQLGKGALELEGELLDKMDSVEPQNLILPDLDIWVYNLALQKNLDLAMKLWDNMVNAPGWDKCQQCTVVNGCPIFRNVSLIRKYQSTINERLRLLLKRIVEYGNRLTMRQLSAHFSYMLCSGHNCHTIRDMAEANQKINLGDFLFTNHFWGDKADSEDSAATQLQSVKIIREQGFETKHAPCIERYMWLQDTDAVWALNIPELESYYNRLMPRAYSEPIIDGGISAEKSNIAARQQIRRMFYFLYTPVPNREAEFKRFMGAFLNSEMLIDYDEWGKDSSKFSACRTNLMGQLFHVLQEQFSGIRMPENGQGNRDLYITIARKHQNIRQSAQIVLGKIGFSSQFELKQDNGKIMLCSKNYQDKICLELTLPFIDYISNRRNGAVGTTLQRSYLDQLENLKNKIRQAENFNDGDGIVLLRQNTDYSLTQQRIRMEYEKLEVSNE